MIFANHQIFRHIYFVELTLNNKTTDKADKESEEKKDNLLKG